MSAMPTAGLRELMSYVIPGGSGMRNKRCVVGARCQNALVDEFTHPDGVGGGDPKWQHGHHGRVLHLHRHRKDDHVGVVSVYQVADDGVTRTWIGGNHFKFSDAVKSPNKEFDQDLPLYVSGTPQGGAGSGILSLKFKWVPAEQTCNLEDLEQIEEEPETQGELVVTVLCAVGLAKPDRIVRDLTTYVDGAPVKLSLFLMVVYLAVGFGFYSGYMSQSAGADQIAAFKKFPELLDRLQGGHGDWDTVNALVFMITSFTTVGYGNHPSLVATLPPCEVPGQQLRIDDPFSSLLPPEMRVASLTRIPGLGMMGDTLIEQSFQPLEPSCFNGMVGAAVAEECMVIADDTHIFGFHNLLLWERGSMEPPRNFSGADRAFELRALKVPGDLGEFDCMDTASAGETLSSCYARFAATCEEQLTLWRLVEKQKDVAKIFTSFFIMLGIGILGAVVGAVGETLMEWVHSLLGGVEFAVDTATDTTLKVAAPLANVAAPLTTGIANAAAPLTTMVGDAAHGVAGIDPTGISDINVEKMAENSKGVLVAFLGLGIVIGLGTIVYGMTESLKFVDALYFTVVTATTVGFGDYYPETTSGKIFTLFYVPFSVVAVAGAINHVAAVPLAERREALENYVLAQFGEHMTEGDFDDIRRSAGIRSEATIRSNDFLIAMSLRLGYLKVEDCQKIKRMFANLDATGDGELTAEDIVNLIVRSPLPSPDRPVRTSSHGDSKEPPLVAMRLGQRLGSRDMGGREAAAGLMESSQDMTGGMSATDVSSNPLADGAAGEHPRDGRVDET